MKALMLVCGVMAIISAVTAVVMAFVKQEDVTSMKVLAQGIICLTVLILFVAFYLL
jgi:uncharacterized membrane protein HdeD (DUF308 family)